jgi:oleate hydratase
MTAGSTIGSNNHAPARLSLTQAEGDGAWQLWEKLAADNPSFGNPANFSTRVDESSWESFTVTLKDPEMFDRLVSMTHNAPGTGALVTFKDSNWLMSIVVPHQPHFIGQPEDIQVFWGYGLFPSREGNIVKKPMADCTGEEILTELLGHLNFPKEKILPNAITRPSMLPYITSQFLTRSYQDRPQVIPAGSTNLAFLGQFVEIPEDVVFTVEYSVRGAQMAVFELMGLERTPKKIYKGEHDIRVLTRALETLMKPNEPLKSILPLALHVFPGPL